ncbi:oxidoreductase [Colletotrichum somersetense]|nr:oxidoreductase [Colletotrichum somersetense]
MFMSKSLVLVAVAAAAASAAADAPEDETLGARIDSQGFTRLYGNSFGRPGYNATYDYIIVGGGNAGNTIAARLALDKRANYSIAVLESGSFYEITAGNRTQVPGLGYLETQVFPAGLGSTLTLSDIVTEPQSGYNGRRIDYLQGQTFGGSTASNGMAYHRATPGTFGQWSELAGDDFWSWDEVYRAYKKSCRFSPPDFTKIDPSLNITWDESAFYKDGGPLHVSYGNHQGAFGPSMEAALEQAGLAPIAGFNSGDLMGYGALTVTVDPRTATRSSSETSFLQEAALRSSIKIYPNALAQRITFDEAKRATGVDVRMNSATADKIYHLAATKEVIVSAGAWHSPQLLMVSGIGPAETLKKHGVSVLVDSPGVGQNEEDQPTVPAMFRVNVTTLTQLVRENPAITGPAVEEYLKSQAGPYSGVGAGQGIGFEKMPESYRKNYSNSTLSFLERFPKDWPEIEWVTYASAPGIGDVGPDDNFISFGAVLLSTASRGNVTIASPDMVDPPIISPNWLVDEGDVEQAYAAFMRMREIASYASIIEEEVFPGPTLTGKDAIIEWLRSNMSYIFHAACTCKMGRDDDPAAVVDSRARVRGVTGLRVVDASAFPSLPPGHPMSTVYMFAERIAESILEGN